MSLTIDILLSAAQAQNKQATVYAENISKNDIDGYTRKQVQTIPLMVGGAGAGVDISQVSRTVDELLQSKVWSQNSSLSYYNVLQDFYTRLQYNFGATGQGVTFAHRLSDIAHGLDTITTDPTAITKLGAVNNLSRFAQSLNDMAKSIQDLRTDTDAQLMQAVTDVNTYLSNIASLNVSVLNSVNSGSSSATFEDQRDMALQGLSDHLDIRILDDGYQKDVFMGSGYSLVFEGTTIQMSYTQSLSGAPGVALSPVTLGGSDVTHYFQSGRMKALLDLRDVILPNLQSQLDEFSRNVRDTLNAMHNLGTGTNPPATLTGTVGVPGSALALTTPLAGTGILRVGVLNSANGQFAGAGPQYVDINLGTLGAGANGQFTLQDLITAINVPASGLTASLTGIGQFQIAVTAPAAGQGVAIGSVGGTNASICLNGGGGGYNPATALGLSHFFGLNNLIVTGNQIYGGSTVGISNVMSLNPNIVANGQALACGALNSATGPIAAGTTMLGPRDLNIATSLSQLVNFNTSNFNAAGDMAASTATLLDYATRVIEHNSTLARNNQTDQQFAQYVYDDLAKQNFDVSGVDLQNEFYNMFQLRQARTLVAKALNISIEIEGAIVEMVR